ncbi:polyketide synthase dehydratase domain-containing protein, partial [Phytoactinopolyspora halophila]
TTTDAHHYQELLYALADLYCQGYELVDPGGEVDAVPPHVGLPTYPFAAEQVWIEPAVSVGSGAHLHPLVHSNVSDVQGLRFVSTVSGREPFVRADGAGDVRVVRDGGVLEMARAAVVLSDRAGERAVQVHDVVWHEALLVGAAGQSVHVELFDGAGADLNWQVCAADADSGDEELVHAAGAARLVERDADVLDLGEVRQVCTEQVQLADTPRVHAVWASPDRSGSGWRVLIDLAVERGVLDPGVVIVEPRDLDAVVAAVAAAAPEPVHAGRMLALRSAELAARGSRVCVASVSVTEASATRLVLDIDGCDETGQVVWRLRGLEYGQARIDADDAAQVSVSEGDGGRVAGPG